MTRYAKRRVLHDIEGKGYTRELIRLELHNRGVKLTEPTLSDRLRKAPLTWAELARPPNENRAKSGTDTYIKRRNEMAEVLAALGPRRRY